jgi:hypothetical protein
MNPKLKRHYGAGDLHFITCNCYRGRVAHIPRVRQLREGWQRRKWGAPLLARFEKWVAEQPTPESPFLDTTPRSKLHLRIIPIAQFQQRLPRRESHVNSLVGEIAADLGREILQFLALPLSQFTVVQ